MGERIIIVDISGKVVRYDNELYSALIDGYGSKNVISLKYPGMGLLDLIPQRYYSSLHFWKRSLKVLEGAINYFFIILLIVFRRPAIIHFQWLPYLEICSIEKYILALIQLLSPHTKILLTVHNVYPHNMSVKKKQQYKKRFRIVSHRIDGFIVHTEISKNIIINEFDLRNDKVFICYHGVFKPLIQPNNIKGESSKFRILQFGGQSYYKGTDIFVDALTMLSDQDKEKIEARIVGGISPDFYEQLKTKDNTGLIKWKPYFLKDEELYREIEECDLVVLPYREISQSGVLMLSFFFGKPLLLSDLPAFVETIQGDKENMPDFFFERGNPQSMCNMLKKHINHQINENALLNRINHLKQLYSWQNSAQMTYSVYNKIANNMFQ